ncbi:hypothetical protein Tco_1382080 [Tanacetum coccineum]
MSRANPQATIVSKEQLVLCANRLKIAKNNQCVASDSFINDTLLKLGIFHSANLDYTSLIWDEFEWKPVDGASRPTKMSKLIYTRFTKLIVDHFLSCNKSIPQRSDAEMHNEGQNSPLTKLINTVDCKAAEEPEEQHVCLVRSGRGKGYMCLGNQEVNLPRKPKKAVVPKKLRTLTIADNIVEETIVVELAKIMFFV